MTNVKPGRESPVVCLDPGHGGRYNPGAVPGYYESEMTWHLASMLKRELENRGISVRLTKDSQAANPGLSARGRSARGADLLLSIHSNGAEGTGLDYPLAICNVDGGTDAVGKKLVETVQKQMATVQAGVVWHKTASSGHGDWYTVLASSKAVGVPGVILEHSFHTNPRACAWLSNAENLALLAREEADVVAAYFDAAPYTAEDFIRQVQGAVGARVDGIAGPETLGKTVTVSEKVNRRHPVVKPIQRRLYALGHREVGEPDGIAGPKFTKAVKAYQRNGGGFVDGEITAGQLTWKRLLGVVK